MSKETQGRVEEILKELGKKIDHLIVEAKDASADIRDEVEQKIADLKEKKEDLEKDFEEYKQQEKWQDAKTHFSAALQELRKAVESVFSKSEA